MNTPGALAGKVIAVTRPRQQASELMQAIAAAGGDPLPAPLLEILPVEDRAPLEAALNCLDDYALGIFISPNAVSHSLPALLAHRGWPAHVQPAAVGQGTLRTLAAYGIHGGVAPQERFDSESLLALPELQATRLAGRRVLILRGDGGRELLAETLLARGAHVDLVTCYRRLPPGDGLVALRNALDQGRLNALTLSSSEGLRYLHAGLNAAQFETLCRLPVFVPHQRIAENAKNIGICHIILTEPADKGLVAGLCAYNWP